MNTSQYLAKYLSCALLAALAAGACGDPEADTAAQEAEAIACTDARMPDRTAGQTPLLSGDALEVVADLQYPPGNVAVSADERIFFSYFPPGNKGSIKVAELVDGVPVAYPNAKFQKKLGAVLGVRVDDQGRLWMLDYGDALGLEKPRLFAVDLATDAVTFEYEFQRQAAPVGSMLNDLQISRDGKTAYISDVSLIGRNPGLVVIDLDREYPIARRRLAKHASVKDGGYDIHVGDEPVTFAGILCPRFAVDGLALDAAGDFLYYAAVNGGALYRASTDDLRYEKNQLLDAQLGARVEKVADITATDGMTTDAAGHVYLSDMEHQAVVRVDAEGEVRVLIQDPRLTWPDGFSWGPDGTLYVTASALNEVVPLSPKKTERRYNIFRIDAQAACDDDQTCAGRVGH